MEDTNRKKKIYRIMGVCFLLVALVTGAVIVSLSGKGSVAKALESGKRYLSNMDYEAAIREYSYVLETEPFNETALAGLAESYAGLGDMEMAERIYEEELGASENVEVWRSYATILEKRGDYAKAAQLITRIMEKEDVEENYRWLETVLEKLLVKQYSYAEEESVVIAAENGEVYTMGSNLLGALGTTENLGKSTPTDSMKKAGFSGTPVSVFTTGANSFVVDENQSLWITGSNRSAQQENNTVEWMITPGWTKDTTMTGVVKVAGTNSTVFTLTSDGTLYFRGCNDGYVRGSAWQGSWTPVQEKGTVLDVQSAGEYIAFLTIEGRLYYKGMNYRSQSYVSQSEWEPVADGVVGFSMNRNGRILYLTEEGLLKDSYYSESALPEEWRSYDKYGYAAGYRPDISIKDFVLTEQGVYLLEDTGKLYYATESGCTEVAQAGLLEHIYEGMTGCIGQKENGGYVLLDASGTVR